MASSSNGSSSSSTNARPPPRRRQAKLPKMNNSERGRYYRRKYKEHEVGLERSVETLHKQVRDLQLFVDIREELACRNPLDACDAVVAHIFEYFERVRDGGIQFEPTFQASSHVASLRGTQTVQDLPALFDLSGFRVAMRQADDAHTTLRFDLSSFDVQGCHTAPVVVMVGTLSTIYSRAMIDNMFPHVLHYPVLLESLLDKEVQYPCTYRFYFGAGGEFHGKIVEADYVHGLQQVVGSLKDVMWLLDGSHRLRRRENSLEDVIRGPPSMALNFILT